MLAKFPRKYIFISLLAAKKAGEVIIKVYNKNFDIQLKDNKSPLTIADKQSHEIIVKHLSQLPNQIPILSEEGKIILYEKRKKWEYLWLVDPLDGTKEFLKRNGEFTVNIALIHYNKPVLGFIYAPASNILYFAAEGFGTYMIDQEINELLNFKLKDNDSMTLFNRIINISKKLSLLHPTSKSLSQIQATQSFTIVGSKSHPIKDP